MKEAKDDIQSEPNWLNTDLHLKFYRVFDNFINNQGQEAMNVLMFKVKLHLSLKCPVHFISKDNGITGEKIRFLSR